MAESVIVTDVTLSRRLERAEGSACVRFVEARAALFPSVSAACTEVAGTQVAFDGPDSPITQTFGLGLFAPAADADLDSIEHFLLSRGAPVFHEVSPLADKALWPILARRGYHPVEFTSVLVMPLKGIAFTGSDMARVAGSDEVDRVARLACKGWAGETSFDDQLFDLMRVVTSRRGNVSFIAEVDGEPAATGALCLHEGVALLAGAATVPRFRSRGAQKALLQARLRYAAEAGCDLAMICAEPGGTSQRNAERQGFRIAYTRVKWGLANGR